MNRGAKDNRICPENFWAAALICGHDLDSRRLARCALSYGFREIFCVVCLTIINDKHVGRSGAGVEGQEQSSHSGAASKWRARSKWLAY